MFPLLFHDKFLSGSGRVDQIPIRIRQKGSDPTGSGSLTVAVNDHKYLFLEDGDDDEADDAADDDDDLLDPSYFDHDPEVEDQECQQYRKRNKLENNCIDDQKRFKNS